MGGRLDQIKGELAQANEKLKELGQSSAPELEPEVKAKLLNVTFDNRKDSKGNLILHAIYWRYENKLDQRGNPIKRPDGTYEKVAFEERAIDIYTFNLMVYKSQVQLLEGKIGVPRMKIGRYETEIKAIEEDIEFRKSDYRREEMKYLGKQDELTAARAEYDEGLGRDFEEGDIQERALKAKIEALEKELPGLDPTIIYRDTRVDIDQPSKGLYPYEDVRTLIGDYKRRKAVIEHRELKPIESRLAINRAYYSKVAAEWQQYQLHLQSK